MRITLACLAFMIISSASAQDIRRINPEGMTQPTAYSHVVRHGTTLYLAGQVATDADGNVIGEGDMGTQVRQVLENMKTVLASQAADFSNVVKITVFTTDIEAYRKTTDIRNEFWAGIAPASTLVQIERLARPEFLVEIEATAVVPEGDN